MEFNAYRDTLINAARRELLAADDRGYAMAAIAQVASEDHVAEIWSEAIATDPGAFRRALIAIFESRTAQEEIRPLLAEQVLTFLDDAIDSLTPGEEWIKEAAARDRQQRREDLKADIRAAG